MWFPIEVWGASRSGGKTDPWGRELGLGSSGKATGKAPVPVSLPEDRERQRRPGVPPPSCSEELP